MNPYFQFKRFTVYQDACAMKVSTDACAFGAWAGERIPATTQQILDIGTGTGLLSLMIAQCTETADTKITAIELDQAAAEQASNNVANSPWADRIQVVLGDILKHSFTRSFEGIICNPPFYKNDLKPSIPNYLQAHHEHSLTAEQLFERAGQLVATSGWMAIMIPPNRWEDYQRLAQQHGWTIEENTTLRHSDKHAPLRQFLWLTKAQCKQNKTTESILRIHQDEQVYHAEFQQLLQPYYIKL